MESVGDFLQNKFNRLSAIKNRSESIKSQAPKSKNKSFRSTSTVENQSFDSIDQPIKHIRFIIFDI